MYLATLFACFSAAPVLARSESLTLAQQHYMAQQYKPVYADFDEGMRDWRDENYDDAFKELNPLAEHGDAVSQYYVGLMHHRGLGVAKDDAQATVWLRKSAEQGYALAQNELGQLFARGRGVAEDPDQARMWFRKAADQGLDKAQYNLGYWLPLQKTGDHRDEEIYWMRKAARQGNPLYQLGLANVYGESGSGQEKLPQSAYWARKAAMQGLGRAQYLLGIFYRYGLGVPKDDKLALHWLLLAAQQGSSDAMAAIASIYDHDPDGGPDRLRAIGWLCKAAELQYGDANNAIGRLSSIGPAGFPCLMKVANAGNAVAQWLIGEHYAYSRDAASAIPWLRKSAQQGYGFALLSLGDMYADGSGVHRDPVLARMFYLLCNVSGYTSRIRIKLTDEQEAEATALAAAWAVGMPFPQSSRTGNAKAEESVPPKK
jgi:hypothetical protein